MRYLQYFKWSFAFFILLSSTTVWSFHPDGLSGAWYHNNQPTTIEKKGHKRYLFCNEDRDCAIGILMGDQDIQVTKWSVTGVLNYNQKIINWSNGTKWTRYPTDQKINIAGQWYHHGKATFIRVNKGGKNFFLTNEMGQTSWGFIQGNQLTLPTLNVVGHLSSEGNRIHWSNNTTWVRY